MVLKRRSTYHRLRASIIIFVLLSGVLFTCITGSASSYKLQWMQSSSIAYGVNVDMTAMIPDTPYTIKTADGGDFFALAARLGINTLRITDIQWELTGKEYPQVVWQRVFDEAENYHMHIILLFVDGGGNRYTAIKQAHTLLDNYGLAHAPALWLVDINNEPDLSDSRLMIELREEAAYVHQIAPLVPVTIGGWKSQVSGDTQDFDWQDPADIPRLINLVDVVAPHLYEFEQGAQQGFTPRQWTQRYLSAVCQRAQHKPILLEEFGAPNGFAPTTEPNTTGSPEWQAFVYRGVFQEVIREHNQDVIGAVAWIIAPRPRPTYPTPGDYQGDMAGWAFVLNHGQQLLSAAAEFSAAVQNR